MNLKIIRTEEIFKIYSILMVPLDINVEITENWKILFGGLWKVAQCIKLCYEMSH